MALTVTFPIITKETLLNCKKNSSQCNKRRR